MSPSQYYHVQKYLLIAVIAFAECISIIPTDCTKEKCLAYSFNPENDATVLRSQLAEYFSNEQAIIDILAHRGIAQRLVIAEKFKTIYDKDLILELKSQLSGSFEEAIVGLMTPLPEYYAMELHNAISGLGTDENALIEILSSLSNSEIEATTTAYKNLYDNELKNDIEDDTSGHFQSFLLSLSNGNRDKIPIVEEAAAMKDANALFAGREGQNETSEYTFTYVLTMRSFPQLRKVIQDYKNISGQSIEDAIEQKFSGDLRDAYLAVVKFARNETMFFSERLNKAMSGMGTDESTLTRIIVGRSEIDLDDIKNDYQSMYGKSLASDIYSDTSGDYRRLLLALLV